MQKYDNLNHDTTADKQYDFALADDSNSIQMLLEKLLNEALSTAQSAEAPDIISTNSIVILACLAVLYYSLSLSTISPAFLEAFSIAAILALYSDAKLFKKATHKFEEI